MQCSRSALVSIYQMWSKEETGRLEEGQGRLSGKHRENKPCALILQTAPLSENVRAGSDRNLPEYRVPMVIPVHSWAREDQNCTMDQWKKVAWSDESCFLLLPGVAGCVCIAYLVPGCTVGRRQADGSSVMLGNTKSCHLCGCYIDHHTFKHCCRSCTPFHGNSISCLLWPLTAAALAVWMSFYIWQRY